MSRALVEIPRGSRGALEYERQKTRDKIVIKLSPQLAASNIMGLLTSKELDDYDIAADSHRWQFALKTLVAHAQSYDLEYIFMIPDSFDIADPSSVQHVTSWTNILLNWKDVSLERCMQWQEFLTLCGGRVDVETDRWMSGVLTKTMEPALQSEISSSMEELDEARRGSITMFRLIAQRIMDRN